MNKFLAWVQGIIFAASPALAWTMFVALMHWPWFNVLLVPLFYLCPVSIVVPTTRDELYILKSFMHTYQNIVNNPKEIEKFKNNIKKGTSR